ncbi:MAG: hypothetical protein R3B09_00990 [Nannocystaceae bacterium]
MTSRETFQELHRRLALVARLRGSALTAAEGVCLVEPTSPRVVRDPQALYRACATGWPTIAALAASIELEDPPLLLRASLLATMRRNLRALARFPGLTEVVGESRVLRRHGIPDAAWLAARDAFLQQISEHHRELAATDEGGDPVTRENAHDGAHRARSPRRGKRGREDGPNGARRRPGDASRSADRGSDRRADASPDPSTEALYARARALCAGLRGEASAQALDDALAHLRDDTRERRRRARRRLAGLLEALDPAAPRRHRPSTPDAAAPDAPDGPILALRRADRLPGRSRRRRLAVLVAELLEVPPLADDDATAGATPGPPAATPGGRRRLVDEVRALGEALVASIRPTGPALLDDARRFLALYGLAFRPIPRDGGPLILTPERIRRGLAAQDPLLDRLAGLDLTLDEALALHAARLGDGLREVAALVADGLPIAAVQGLCAAERGGDLAEFAGDPATATAYARWALALGPHYKAMGLGSPILPETFRRVAGKKADLGVLTLCLINQSGDAGALGAERAIARLDATLGLFERRPAEIAQIVAALAATTPGAGRAAFPGFAAWLDDDPLLDRIVQLSRLAGRPLALSRRLLSDYERGDALLREEAALSAMSSRTDRQEARLRRLRAGEVALPDPAWTRRRLHEEALALHAAAYDAQLAAVFRRILRDAFGLDVAATTPAWRDAIRFYLATDRNHELLREVLRAAAAGDDLDRTSPANRAWIAAARQRFAVDAWLAPRSRTPTIGGHPCELRIERDPVEVLRMGVPFDTCLSISGGSNAASTVINAADSNKRVLYLRDRKGAILARQLVAVADRDDAILTYRLYIADRDHVDAILAAFAALLGELSAATGLPLRAHGTPAQLHPGFWYDDEPEALTAGGAPTDEGIAAYCAALGVPTPSRPGDALVREAALFATLKADDPQAIAAALERARAPSPLRERAVAAIVGRVDDPTLWSACAEDEVLRLLRQAWRGDPRPLIDAADGDDAWRSHNALSAAPGGPATATALVEVALARRRRGLAFDDHGLEHQTLFHLPHALRRAPVALGLALAGRIEPVWAWIEASEPSCGDCVRGGRGSLDDALITAYAAAPDPAAVRQALTDRRSPPLRRRVALAIAAAHRLGEVGEPSLALTRALHRLGTREIALRDEATFVAALLRQCGGAVPHGVALPTAAPGPFEHLGAACLDPAIAARLGPWLASTDVEGFVPGAWELALRRRRPTPIVAALAAEAARWAPGSSRAALWLARLGEVAALDQLRSGPWGPEADNAAPDRPNLTLDQLHAHSRAVAGQLALIAATGGALDPAGKLDPELRRAINALGRLALDVALLAAARRTIERRIASVRAQPPSPAPPPIEGDGAAPPDEARDPEAELAASILEHFHPTELSDLLAGIAAAPGPLPPALARVARHALGQGDWQWNALSPRLALDLADHPELRAEVVQAIARRFHSDLDTAAHTLAAAADDVADAARAEALIDDLCRHYVLETHDDLSWIEGPLFRRCVAHTLTPGRPRAYLIELYRRIESPSRAVEVLDALDDDTRRDPNLRRAALTLELDDDLDDRVVREWLRLRLLPSIGDDEVSEDAGS